MLTRLTDPVGNDSAYEYDSSGRMTRETNELRNSRTFQYDPVGNLRLICDRNGRARSFQYDLLNRLTAESWGNGEGWDCGVTSSPTSSGGYQYAYDAVGRVIQAWDGNSNLYFSYDDADRQVAADIQSSSSEPQDVPHAVLTSTFDARGQRTRLATILRGMPNPVLDTPDFTNE